MSNGVCWENILIYIYIYMSGDSLCNPPLVRMRAAGSKDGGRYHAIYTYISESIVPL